MVTWFQWFHLKQVKTLFLQPSNWEDCPQIAKVCKLVNRSIDFTDIAHLPNTEGSNSFLAQTMPMQALPDSQLAPSLLSNMLWCTQARKAIIVS